MTFVIEHDVDFTRLTRTNNSNTTPQTQLLTTGYYDWAGGCWYTAGGPLTGIPVVTPGSYSVAPTGINTAGIGGQGSAARQNAPTAHSTLSAGGIGAEVLDTPGWDFISNPLAPALTGGTGSGGVLGVPIITKINGAGTLSCTNGSAAVVGTSTTFITSVIAGEDILINNHIYNILSITDDTHLTLSTNFGQTTAGSLSYSYGGNCAAPGSNLNALPTITGGYIRDLLRPVNVATQDQQIDIYFYAAGTGGGSTMSASLRFNASIGTYGEKFCINASSSVMSITHFDGNSTASTIANQAAPSSWVIGNLLKLTASAVNNGTNTCTLSYTLTDTITSTQIASGSTTVSTSTTYPNLAAAGQVGVTGSGAQGMVTRLTTYNASGLLISPTTVTLNQTGVVLSVSNPAAHYLTSPPSLTLSGGNPSLGSVTVIDDTHFTVPISTGTIAAAITMTDATTGGQGTFTALAMVSPPALINPYTATTSGATITATTFALNGNANFQYQLYRSPNSNFAYNDGSATLVHTQTGVAASTIPNAVTDTTAPPNTQQFYAWVTTDSTGQIAQGTQYSVQILAPWSGTQDSIQMGFIGDSLTNGHDATALIQQLTGLGVTAQGSGQTDGTYNVTVSGGGGNSAVVKAVVSGGKLVYAYPTDGGFSYTTEANTATFSYSAGGTPGTISASSVATGYLGGCSANTGGGFPLALQNIIRGTYGSKNFKCINQGHGGSAASSWVPNATGNSLEAAKGAFQNSTLTPFIHIMLGSNDASGGQSAATYSTNIQLIVADLISNGYKVGLSYPTYWPGGSPSVNNLIQQYRAKIDLIIAANPGNVVPGWQGSANGVLVNGQNYLFQPAGDPHWNDAGYAIMAGVLASIVAKQYGLATGNPPSRAIAGPRNSATGRQLVIG